MSTNTAWSVAKAARLRVAKSEDSAEFLGLVHRGATRTAPDPDLDAWGQHFDPVAVAAEIEVLAGARRLAARSHRARCACDACRVRARIAARNDNDDTQEGGAA